MVDFYEKNVAKYIIHGYYGIRLEYQLWISRNAPYCFIWGRYHENHQPEGSCILRAQGFAFKELNGWNLLNVYGTMILYVGVSKNSGTPKSSIFYRVFHYKPSILGYPYFRKPPYIKGREETSTLFCVHMTINNFQSNLKPRHLSTPSVTPPDMTFYTPKLTF